MNVPKIMCTLGPATENPVVLRGMKDQGMTAVRIHSIYGTISDMSHRIELVRTLGEMDIFLDLKGPQVRLRCEETPKLKDGSSFQVFFKPSHLWIDQPILPQLRPGTPISFGKGIVQGEITRVAEDNITIKITNSFALTLSDNIDVSIPGLDFAQLPPLSDRDKKVVHIGVEKHVQGFAPSFVRDYNQVHETVAFIEDLRQNTKGAPPITYLFKIQDALGVQNLPDILVQGRRAGLRMIVMVARGELFHQLPPEDLPVTQQYIVSLCQQHQTPVMVATGIFTSMKDNTEPTRAEYMDLFQIAVQGIDWILLSDEIANGTHPVEVVGTVKKTLQRFAASIV